MLGGSLSIGPLVFVPRRADGDQAVHSAVLHKLTELGARIAPRFGKEVTHVVFLKKLFPSNQEQSQQDAALRDLYERVFKAGSSAVVVSNLWVNASAEQGSWAKVADYVIERPAEPIDARFYAISPPKAGNGNKRNGSMGRRKSAGAVPLPASALNLDLDDSLFSSSQQINDIDKPSAGNPHLNCQRISLLGKRHAPTLQPPAKRVAVSTFNASAASEVRVQPAAQQGSLTSQHQTTAGATGKLAVNNKDLNRSKPATTTAAKTPGSQPTKRRRSTKTPGSSAATTPREAGAKDSPAANAGSRTAPPAARSTELLESLARLQGGCQLNLSPEKPGKLTPSTGAAREPSKDRLTPRESKERVTPWVARHQSAPRVRAQEQKQTGVVCSQPAIPTLAQRLQSRAAQPAAEQGMGDGPHADLCTERARKSVAWAENLTPNASPVAGLQVPKHARSALAPTLRNGIPISPALQPLQPSQPASCTDHTAPVVLASAAVQAGTVSAPCTAIKPGQEAKGSEGAAAPGKGVAAALLDKLQQHTQLDRSGEGTTTFMLGSQEAAIVNLRAMSEPPSSAPGHDRQSDASASSVQAVQQADVAAVSPPPQHMVSPAAAMAARNSNKSVLPGGLRNTSLAPAGKASAGNDSLQPVLLQVPKLKLLPNTASRQQDTAQPGGSCVFEFGAMTAATMGTPTLARAAGAQQQHQQAPPSPSRAVPSSSPSPQVGIPLSKRLAAFGAGAKRRASCSGTGPVDTSLGNAAHGGAGPQGTTAATAKPDVQAASAMEPQPELEVQRKTNREACIAGVQQAAEQPQGPGAVVIDLTVGEAGALSQKEGSVSNQSAPRSVLPVVPQRQHKSYKQAKLTSLLAIPVLLPRPDIGGGKPQGGPAAVKPVQPRTDNSTQHGADVNDQTEQQQRQQENNSVVKCIATTSVDPAVSAALKDAVSKLGGAHVYVEGQADIHITHLVIGAERRTIKCLLAIAAGAHLVSPSWVTSSRAAGRWLPEEGFQAAPRWSGTAAVVRQRQSQQPAVPPPLTGRQVYVHCGADKPVPAAKSAELRQGLQRLVVALGGKVAPVRACSLAVLVAGASAPSGIPKDSQIVTDDWLLSVAETHTIPAQ